MPMARAPSGACPTATTFGPPSPVFAASAFAYFRRPLAASLFFPPPSPGEGQGGGSQPRTARSIAPTPAPRCACCWACWQAAGFPRRLTAMGGEVQTQGTTIELRPSHRPLAPLTMTVPGDFSSAAFWMAAAALRPDWSITIRGVGLNPTRIAFADLLQRMGADVQLD